MSLRLKFDRSVAHTTAFRLLTFLTIVLTPIGLIAVFQTQALHTQLRQKAEAALLSDVLKSVEPQQRMIDRMIGSAEVLGTLSGSSAADIQACSDNYAALVAGSETVRFGGLLGPKGIFECNSAGRRLDMSDDPDAISTFDKGVAWASARATGRVSGSTVFIMGTPVKSVDGKVTHFSVLSMAQKDLIPQDNDGQTLFGSASAHFLFNQRGEILTEDPDDETVTDFLPGNLSLTSLSTDEPLLFEATAQNGQSHTYVVIPLYHGAMYSFTSWPTKMALEAFSTGVPVWLFPILMWLTTLVVAYISVNRLVLRHTSRLGARMRRFALDRRMPDLAPDPRQPAEFTEMDRNFRNMAEAILRDEAELENTVREKGVLLREVHHRVKNNLQLIASIMNMQIRSSRNSETSTIVRRLQDRVLSLAAVHQKIYQAETLSRIDVNELLSDILQKTLMLGLPGGADVKIEASFDHINMHPDQAVPLALLLAEASTNALKYMGRPENGEAYVSASLIQREDQMVEFRFSNAKGDPFLPPMEDGGATTLGSQLIAAFCKQLGGKLLLEDRDDSYTLMVEFLVADYDIAEQID